MLPFIYNTRSIFTCTQKLTQVSLIYHTEPTTKKWKTEKLKSKKRVCSEVSVNSPQGIHGVCAEEEKEGTRTVADDVQDSDWTESWPNYCANRSHQFCRVHDRPVQRHCPVQNGLLQFLSASCMRFVHGKNATFSLSLHVCHVIHVMVLVFWGLLRKRAFAVI